LTGGNTVSEINHNEFFRYYQCHDKIIKCLTSIFGGKYNDEDNIKAPYKVFEKHKLGIYKPEVDIGIGPFSERDKIYNSDYDELTFKFQDLITDWITDFRANWQPFVDKKKWLKPLRGPEHYRDFITANTCGNARCFIAIELENQTDRKYVMGSVVNAGILGRIGILVAENSEVFRNALRTRQYFDHLQEDRGRAIVMSNLIVLTIRQFLNNLSKYS
jgi:hypothetical protein